MNRILIIGVGNNRRSQIAHGVLQSYDPKELYVRSAGVKPLSEVDPEVVKLMAEIDIDISEYTSDSVDGHLSEHWDYVITLCDEARESFPEFVGDGGFTHHFKFDLEDVDFSSAEDLDAQYRTLLKMVKRRISLFYGEDILGWNNAQCACGCC